MLKIRNCRKVKNVLKTGITLQIAQTIEDLEKFFFKDCINFLVPSMTLIEFVNYFFRSFRF